MYFHLPGQEIEQKGLHYGIQQVNILQKICLHANSRKSTHYYLQGSYIFDVHDKDYEQKEIKQSME